ncbi:ATP-binding protein [Streptomyces geranii]|uniref:ATP-binding protein n=1 Tax=Streptomyces geranii TaxID=2058923 RepID=UPI002FCDBEFF
MPLTTFVGRGGDLAEVCRRLEVTRLLTLTGVGGVGKSRLAVQVATSSVTTFADGTWVIDLAAVREPSVVAGTVASTLGVPDVGAQPVVDQLGGYLAWRRALIVLDNCEHIVDACAELVQQLLSAAPGLCVMTTSRQSLGLIGEHVHIVSSLPPDEAVELLRVRAAAVRSESRVTDVNRDHAVRLCAELEGLPLAIELAASRLRTLTVDQVADRLEDRFALLTGGSRTASPRQRTLRATVEWSYGLCSPAERLLWHRLSVFAGSFALEAAEGVCAGESIQAHQVLDLLGGLITQSVVLTTEAEGLPRYHMLKTIREYGRERLTESGEEECLRLRHRDFHLALAEQIADGWHGPGQELALARMRADHPDLLAALDCPGDPQVTLALAAALRYHWCVGGFLGEGRRRLEGAIEVAPEPTPARVEALLAAGWVALLHGDHAAADQWLDEAAELGRQLDDPAVRARAQHLRGILAAVFREQPHEAVSMLEDAVAAYTALGKEAETALPLFQLGLTQLGLRDPQATGTCGLALAAAEAHGDRWGHAHALWALGLDAFSRGEPEKAMESTRAALKIEQGFTDYVGAVLMVEDLAWMSASCGYHQQAARQLGAAGALWRDIGIAPSAFPLLAERHAQCEEDVVQALGSAGYEKAFAEGGVADSRARAIAVALESGIEPVTPVAVPSPLTPREREIAPLVAGGMSNKQIAAELMVSPRTVDRHIDNIRTKLGFSRRTQIAAWWTAHHLPVVR